MLSHAWKVSSKEHSLTVSESNFQSISWISATSSLVTSEPTSSRSPTLVTSQCPSMQKSVSFTTQVTRLPIEMSFHQGGPLYCPGVAFVPLLGSCEWVFRPLIDTLSGHPASHGLCLEQLLIFFFLSCPQRNFVCFGPGFSIELDRVKNLPYCETETFEVRFDTQGGNVSVGNKEVILPIKVRCSTGPSWSSNFKLCLPITLVMLQFWL